MNTVPATEIVRMMPSWCKCPWARYPWTLLLGSAIPWILRPLIQIIPDRCVLTLDRARVQAGNNHNNSHSQKSKLCSPNPTHTERIKYDRLAVSTVLPRPNPNIMPAPQSRETRETSVGKDLSLGLNWTLILLAMRTTQPLAASASCVNHSPPYTLNLRNRGWLHFYIVNFMQFGK